MTLPVPGSLEAAPAPLDFEPQDGEPKEALAGAPMSVAPDKVKLESLDTLHQRQDPSTSEKTLSQSQWERLSGQRDVMIKAMVGVFTWLNGGVFAFTVVAWAAGIFVPSYKIVDSNTLMALIGATVAQAGIAFVAITRFLFPNPKSIDST